MDDADEVNYVKRRSFSKWTDSLSGVETVVDSDDSDDS